MTSQAGRDAIGGNVYSGTGCLNSGLGFNETDRGRVMCHSGTIACSSVGGGLFHQNDQSILSFSSLGDWGDDKWYTIRLPHLPNASSIFDSCCGSQLARNSSDEKLVLRPSALEGPTRVVNLLESKARRAVKHCHKSY